MSLIKQYHRDLLQDEFDQVERIIEEPSIESLQRFESCLSRIQLLALDCGLNFKPWVLSYRQQMTRVLLGRKQEYTDGLFRAFRGQTNLLTHNR